MASWRLVLTAVGSVLIMVIWLIVYHHLWEPVRHRPVFERDQALHFNVSTVLTLLVGVGFMYVGLYLANLAVSSVVLTPSVFGQYVGDTGFLVYARGHTYRRRGYAPVARGRMDAQPRSPDHRELFDQVPVRLLVDGDVANNCMNWQWVAGTGTDTRPNRVLNPLRQAERYDLSSISPAGRQWCVRRRGAWRVARAWRR